MSAQDDATTNQRDAMRDAMTDAMDIYLTDGVEAVEARVGNTINRQGLDCAATYMLGCALLHAAHVIAQALANQGEAPGQAKKNSCAISHAKGGRPEVEPAAKPPTMSARDPELIRMEREAALAVPMPESLKAKAAIWKREAVGDGHSQPRPTR